MRYIYAQEGGKLMRFISKILMFVAIMLAVPALILWVISQLIDD